MVGSFKQRYRLISFLDYYLSLSLSLSLCLRFVEEFYFFFSIERDLGNYTTSIRVETISPLLDAASSILWCMTNYRERESSLIDYSSTSPLTHTHASFVSFSSYFVRTLTMRVSARGDGIGHLTGSLYSNQTPHNRTLYLWNYKISRTSGGDDRQHRVS